MLIIITFPNRTLSWFQIGSVTVSSFMTLWTAANLFQLKLEKENRETMFVRALKKVRTFSLTAPLILTSLVFNFSNIILGIINNNFFFVLYMFAAFVSILLPATFSPAASVKNLEKRLGLDDDRARSFCGRGRDKERVAGNLEESDQIQPPKDFKGLIKNTTRACNVAFTNMFCLSSPLGRKSYSDRHFMIGIYPLHFVVNMATLVFERYFSNTDVITIRGHIFNYNNIVLFAIFTGIANLILFAVFYYPNIFYLALRSTAKKTYTGVKKTSVKAAKSMEKNRIYKLAEARRKAEKQVKITGKI